TWLHIRSVSFLFGRSRSCANCVTGLISVGIQNALTRDGTTTETVRDLRGLDRGSNILDRRAHRDTPTQRMTSSSVKTSLVALSAMASATRMAPSASGPVPKSPLLYALRTSRIHSRRSILFIGNLLHG